MPSQEVKEADTVTHVINSDGTTVWINSMEKCVARFGRAGYEIVNPHGDWINVAVVAVEAPKAWNDFVKLVKFGLNIEVGATHCPLYAKPSNS